MRARLVSTVLLLIMLTGCCLWTRPKPFVPPPALLVHREDPTVIANRLVTVMMTVSPLAYDPHARVDFRRGNLDADQVAAQAVQTFREKLGEEETVRLVSDTTSNWVLSIELQPADGVPQLLDLKLAKPLEPGNVLWAYTFDLGK